MQSQYAFTLFLHFSLTVRNGIGANRKVSEKRIAKLPMAESFSFIILEKGKQNGFFTRSYFVLPAHNNNINSIRGLQLFKEWKGTQRDGPRENNSVNRCIIGIFWANAWRIWKNWKTEKLNNNFCKPQYFLKPRFWFPFLHSPQISTFIISIRSKKLTQRQRIGRNVKRFRRKRT